MREAALEANGKFPLLQAKLIRLRAVKKTADVSKGEQPSEDRITGLAIIFAFQRIDPKNSISLCEVYPTI